MISFDEICKDFEQMSAEQRGALYEKKVVDVMAKLAEVSTDAVNATALFGFFVTGAIMADDELNEDEFAVMKAGYDALGLDMSFAECEKLLKMTKVTMDQVVGGLSDVLAGLDDDIIGDLLLVCLVLCSLDGEINAAEKEWMIKLFD